jgi:hypothetical protein
MRKAAKGGKNTGSVKPYDDEGRLWTEVGGTPIEVVAFEPAKFDEYNEAAAKFFAEHGYVVIKGAATPEQLAEAENLFWTSSSRWYGVQKDKVEGWQDDQWPCIANTTTGVVSNDSSAHTPFMWYARGIPKVKRIFASLWQTEELLVSFDGYGAFRPPELYGQTRGGWFHLDQNGYNKKGLQCAQGLLNIYPSGAHDGGLVVVPGSHRLFDGWFRDGLMQKRKSDFMPLASMNVRALWGDTKPIKPILNPGDFVLWDSRTTHCSHPAIPMPDYPKRLRRLVAYICMTPSQKAGQLRELREKRLEAYQNGITLNHWPHEYNAHPTDHGSSGRFRYEPVPLNDHQMNLLLGQHAEQ